MAEASRLVVVRTVLIQHTVRFHVADIAFGCPFLDVHRLHQFGYEFSVRDFLPASEDFFYDTLQLLLFPFLFVLGRFSAGRYVISFCLSHVKSSMGTSNGLPSRTLIALTTE